jgi:predicted AAA+ superfamily ATPase
LIRFDLQALQDAGLRPLLAWYETEIRQRPLGEGTPPLLLLDEIHKLDRWAEQVKHIFDTFKVRLVLTGSSSVLVARGQRESLAGRALTVDFPPFLFREVLECWKPTHANALPPPIPVPKLIEDPIGSLEVIRDIHRQPPQRKLSWRRMLERYYNRGGYPRLYAEESAAIEDRWADYLVETVFERVLGVDIPDLFPVEQPRLLRHIYLEVARRTGTEVSQGALTQECNAAGFRTAQPVVGRYLHYLADAMLIREFRRYPLTRSASARVPMKVTLTDLGVRNAIFRGAPSLWESAPDVVGPLVETLVQSVIRGTGLQVHFYRDYSVPKNRRSPLEEVDFVPETIDGKVIPIEVKFRQRIDGSDLRGVRSFINRYKAKGGLVVTRELFRIDDTDIGCVPILEFMLAL